MPEARFRVNAADCKRVGQVRLFLPPENHLQGYQSIRSAIAINEGVKEEIICSGAIGISVECASQFRRVHESARQAMHRQDGRSHTSDEGVDLHVLTPLRKGIRLEHSGLDDAGAFDKFAQLAARIGSGIALRGKLREFAVHGCSKILQDLFHRGRVLVEQAAQSMQCGDVAGRRTALCRR